MSTSRNLGTVDVAILGAGPAGLAAATRLTGSGLNVALIDAGLPVADRDRHNPHQTTRGHGGAGLFSDGKFSFYPSATALWSLPRATGLHAAYTWTTGVLAEAGLSCPPFPDHPQAYSISDGAWALKDYPSDYLSLQARLDLTARLVDGLDAHILTSHHMTAAGYDASRDAFHLALDHDGRHAQLQARRLLVATGRFGPLALDGLTGAWRFRRLEAGLRIEQRAGLAFFADMPQLDPKLRFRDPGENAEWRTFCVCRAGETVATETSGLWTVSGRSDCPPTGRSNTGFNVRVLDETLAGKLLPPLLNALGDPACHFTIPLAGVLAGECGALARLEEVYGAGLRDLLLSGVNKLIVQYPAIAADGTMLIGPTLEGVGRYPRLDGDLRLLDAPAWVAGDACGLFRGIIAAMISGHYAAATLAAAWERS
ncbi:FAD-dependent oxidoreductase [Nonomuraea sp. NPDC050536]|uniref:FAD-dependent oxidoreductase n=1 Tax=Nonomuraea sp. NPDC050536 TaxID=3364366 RepID=UPI0037CB17B2